MLSIKKWSLQIVECPIVEMQFYFSGGAIEADNKGVARTKALNIAPSTGQPGFLCLAFLPMASTASLCLVWPGARTSPRPDAPRDVLRSADEVKSMKGGCTPSKRPEAPDRSGAFLSIRR
jgi:hypothetical protein